MDTETVDMVDRRNVDKVIRSVTRNRGKYTFLIGAGTSFEADIPLASELIERCKRKLYIEEHAGLTVECEDEDPDLEDYKEDIGENADDIHKWVNDYRTERMKDHHGEYGFWMSECYTTREERRQYIHDQVADADVTFGHIMLAGLLNAEPPYVSHVLTPNFDDLLYEAFYEYFDERPRLLNHNAIIGPEFKLTSSDPAIIKLHGDYLYSNLQNTALETSTLKENMRNALQRTLQEYGLVVVGYSGRDDSIMDVLTSEEFTIPEPGIIWCAHDTDNLPQNVLQLLRKPNTYLTEIEGFEELMADFYRKVRYDEGFLFPRAKEIEDRMQKLAHKVVAEVKEARDESRETHDIAAKNIENTSALEGLRYRLEGSFWEEKKEGNYAKTRYKRAIKADRDDPMNYIALAGYYHRNSRSLDHWIQAEDLYTVAMRIPCAETMPDKEYESIELENETLNLNSLDLDGLDDMRIYYGRGNVRRRIARTLMHLYLELREEVGSSPSQDDKSLLRCVRAAVEEKWEETLRDFKWAVDRDPDAYSPYLGKGITCFRRGQFHEDIVELMEGEDIVELMEAKEQYQTSKRSHEQAADRSPNEEDPRLSRAEVAFRLKDFETAAEEAERAAILSRNLGPMILAKYFQFLSKVALRQSSQSTAAERNQLKREIKQLQREIEDRIEDGYEISWVKNDVETVTEAVQNETPAREQIGDKYVALISGEDGSDDPIEELVKCVRDQFNDTDINVHVKEGFLVMEDSDDGQTDIDTSVEPALLYEGTICGRNVDRRLDEFLQAMNADLEVLDEMIGLVFTSQDVERVDNADEFDIETKAGYLVLVCDSAAPNKPFENVVDADDFVAELPSGEDHPVTDDESEIRIEDEVGIDLERTETGFDRTPTDYLEEIFEDEIPRPDIRENLELLAEYIDNPKVSEAALKDRLDERPNRINILRKFRNSDDIVLTASELASELPWNDSNVSRCLSDLEEKDVVNGKKIEGDQVWWLNEQQVPDSLDEIEI